jgi:hypothetical protein
MKKHFGSLRGRCRFARRAALMADQRRASRLPRCDSGAPLSRASRDAAVVVHCGGQRDASGRGRAAGLNSPGKGRPGRRRSRRWRRGPSSRIALTGGLALDLVLSRREAGPCDPPLAEGAAMQSDASQSGAAQVGGRSGCCAVALPRETPRARGGRRGRTRSFAV